MKTGRTAWRGRSAGSSIAPVTAPGRPHSLFSTFALCLRCVSGVRLVKVHAPFRSGSIIQLRRTLVFAGFTHAVHQGRAVFVRVRSGCFGSCQRGLGRVRFCRGRDWLYRPRKPDRFFPVEISASRASSKSGGKKHSEWPVHFCFPSSRVKPHPALSCSRHRR